jgi:hypothetical protein
MILTAYTKIQIWTEAVQNSRSHRHQMFGHTALFRTSDGVAANAVGDCVVIIGGLHNKQTESNQIDCIELRTTHFLPFTTRNW